MTTKTHNDLFLNPSPNRIFNVGGHISTFKITGKDTDGSYSLMASIIEPDAGVTPHIHSLESEGFYIVQGQMEFLLGDRIVIANAGDFVHSPKGEFHTWKNTGSIPAKVLFFFTPAGIENLFDEIGVPVEGPGSMESITPEYLEKFHEACQRYGCQTRF